MLYLLKVLSMVWCYLCAVSFVDLTAQLRSVGEYQKCNVTKKLLYNLLYLCVCHSNGLFVCFSQGEEEQQTGQ